MSTYELAKSLIDHIPESRMYYVISYLQGAAVPDEAPNADTESLSDNELSELYLNWWENRSPEEYKLHETIIDYEDDLFEDMTFQKDSLCWEITSFAYGEFELYFGLEPAKYRFYIVDDTPEYCGECNNVNRAIFITRSHIDDKSTILHEMIHAFEFILNQKHPILHEYLLLALYKKLSPLIPDLDKRLAEHGELCGQNHVASSGGYHGLLFYLKSLDLDIRCGYKLGTVCGYGRDTGDMWY